MGKCQCGSQINHSYERLGCPECGGTVCPKCAVPLESDSYCHHCAETLLGSDTVESSAPFDLRG